METTDTRIRFAAVRDAQDILAIYAPYILNTPITFETCVPTLDAFEDRMKDIVFEYPYLVAEEHGEIVGYAYAHRLGERAAYQWNAELSVYLAPQRRGRGLGRALSQAVLRLLELQGVHNVFSLITLPNEASIHMHEALGFRACGIQRQAGYKLGAWHDVGWFQKQLGDFSQEPTPVQRLRDCIYPLDRSIFMEAERAAGNPNPWDGMPKCRPRKKRA